ncbi:hypothetical protein BU25DRAFT_460448 [Macroventuria anomochaeta]|uniref:Uncharacterized protein n=1 Tax=Macroventuria anomochaeta TaxID=301207 RepID=A0ACB6RUB8_9PLEO|nr:uncharacterized protein BU25DRAFT_460448 [Macroventuria anomochaeta]KAF2625333.1 hypothetical protein BU25DRAFT_460448 [Macroventuria anomochaeta]
MSIRPLPVEVVAQIKSSTAIVSLTGVILELLKNSLDAKASRIDVTVDFARGGCTVEDDGLGIPPAEFGEDGGLGKLYRTSKYQSDEPHLGQHGTFLASLSAMSLLTITSHHHAYRSHNSISFHHAQAIERQTPTTAQNHVYGKHGTRVTVRNLFGNMPVRVKQRAVVTDQKAEQHRLRDTLQRDTVGLLLSWQGPVSLKIRDGDNKTIVSFNTLNAAVAGNSRSAAIEKPRSTHLSSLLHIMTQANYIAIDEWASWVPASASTPAISVKGAISLEPAPTKHAQFISFGLRPLSSENGGNELYDQVNRLFAMSSFGTVEDDADVNEQEKLRRQSDRRFKNDGYTNRQLKARKGVDRYPMFHLRISLKDRHASDVLEDLFIENETDLQAVADIFSVMITQWLSVHHFRPRKVNQSSYQPKIASKSSRDSDEQNSIPSRKRQASLGTPARSSMGTPDLRPAATDTTKNKRRAMATLENSLGKPRPQAFADWSRIKSGKSSFFDATHFTQKAQMVAHPQTFSIPTLQGIVGQPSCSESQQEYAAFDIAPIHQGALGEVVITPSLEPSNNTVSALDDKDETVLWTDLSTKKTYLLNARTGCVMPPRQPRTDPAALLPTTTRLNTSRSLRIAPKSATAEPVKTPWLDGLLQTWDNPVFKPSEQGIQQMSLQDKLEQGESQRPQHSHTHCSRFDMQKAFDVADSSSARLSKNALRSAEVISQVDRKFILVRMAGSSTNCEAHLTADIMALIDQHAADERIQVESLLSDLCRPVHSDTHSGYQSKLGLSSSVKFVNLEKPLHFAISPHEYTHFETFAPNFAAWGILYDISSSVPLGSRTGMTEKDTCKLSVTTLPLVISERCKADPQVLISFLRSAAWKYVESPPLVQAAANEHHTNWVKKIATSPPGLVDMVNSRACRSAIMFNDKLSTEGCKALVKKLADCVFPFMCAHGRPSMVPVVDMGRLGHAGDDFGRDEMHREETFVNAWKKWKR